MRVRKLITIAAAAAVLAVSGAALAAELPGTPAGPSRRTPVTYQGAGAGWPHAARRPDDLALGTLWGVRRVSWSRWTDASAQGHGRLWACVSAGGPCLGFRADVTLSHVRVRSGTRYYTQLTLTGAGRRTQRLTMDRPGGWTLTTAGYNAP